jgi:hypothetical protein
LDICLNFCQNFFLIFSLKTKLLDFFTQNFIFTFHKKSELLSFFCQKFQSWH